VFDVSGFDDVQSFHRFNSLPGLIGTYFKVLYGIEYATDLFDSTLYKSTHKQSQDIFKPNDVFYIKVKFSSPAQRKILRGLKLSVVTVSSY
jgi:hypothetical protein